MSSPPPRDPLAALWQSAPQPDTSRLLQDLRRHQRLHRSFNRTLLWILRAIALLLIFEEATGRLPTHGVLSGIWILGLAIQAVRRRRTRRNRSDILNLDTVSLLKVMIARAGRDLSLARWLYAGTPCGALAGYVALQALGLRQPAPAVLLHPTLHLLQTVAGAAVLIAMTAAGAIWSRSLHHQLRELSEKLKPHENNL